MKKILATILVCSMMLALAACNKDNPSPQPNPPVDNPSTVEPSTPSNNPSDSEPDVIIPEYSDDNVIVSVDGEDVVFIGNASVTWEIEGHDDGIEVTQNAETVVMTPKVDNQELTVSILEPDVVKYFITITKAPAAEPTVYVEKLELDGVEQPVHGTAYADIDEMINLVYNTLPEETYPPSVASTDIKDYYQEDGGYEYVCGVKEFDGLEYGVVSEPMMSSQAYSLIIMKFDTNANAQTAAEKLMEKPPLAKWICVEADKAFSKVVKDTYVIFAMTTEETISEIDAINF